VPLLREITRGGSFVADGQILRVEWTAQSGARLHLVANFGDRARDGIAVPRGDPIFTTDPMPRPGTTGALPRCGVAFFIEQRS
jgi:maltooligosyltrehalose trehalohydrolase